jgi:WhiB family redox-sensing transcriptional regulator
MNPDLAEVISILARALLCEGCAGIPSGVCRTCGLTREQWREAGDPGSISRRRIAARVSPRRTGRWQDSAECRGMDPGLFFPSAGQHVPVEAIGACARCPVRRECYEAAVAGREHGVWGGTSEDDRHQRRQDRNRAAKERAA